MSTGNQTHGTKNLQDCYFCLDVFYAKALSNYVNTVRMCKDVSSPFLKPRIKNRNIIFDLINSLCVYFFFNAIPSLKKSVDPDQMLTYKGPHDFIRTPDKSA